MGAAARKGVAGTIWAGVEAFPHLPMSSSFRAKADAQHRLLRQQKVCLRHGMTEFWGQHEHVPSSPHHPLPCAPRAGSRFYRADFPQCGLIRRAFCPSTILGRSLAFAFYWRLQYGVLTSLRHSDHREQQGKSDNTCRGNVGGAAFGAGHWSCIFHCSHGLDCATAGSSIWLDSTATVDCGAGSLWSLAHRRTGAEGNTISGFCVGELFEP